MTDDTLLPFDLPSVCRKKITVDFNGGNQSSNGGLLLLREKERMLGVCWRLANTMTDGPVAGPVGIEGGVVSGVTNLESPGVDVPGRRPRHEECYQQT
jgi:hypothetical protein